MSHQAVAPSKDQYLYVLVRSDLSAGMQLAQACHGVAEFARDHPTEFASWMETSNYIVVLQVADEVELLNWCDRLSGWCAPFAEMADVAYSLVHEPDISEHTALVIAPSRYWPEFSHLPLAGREVAMV